MGIRFLGKGYPRSKIMWPKKEPPILRNGNHRRCFFRWPPTPTATVVSTPGVINTVFNDVCRLAGVKSNTPHDARHAMGRHLIEKNGNIAAVQRQFGCTNAAYSIQYASVTDQELADALDDR